MRERDYLCPILSLRIFLFSSRTELIFSPSHGPCQLPKGWTLSTSLLVAGLPAAIYAVQSVLYVFAYQNLDAVTFNGLAQTKTLSAALCCFLLLGQRQSPVQLLSLMLLATSALIFQGTLTKFVKKRVYVPAAEGGDVSAVSSRFALGIVPCLAASFLSGLAGALSQKGLQFTGGSGRNAYLYTIEVSAFSAICLTLSLVSELPRAVGRAEKTGGGIRNLDLFKHWSPKTFYPIFIRATGGVLTALVHKHAGSVAKGFAMICGLVLSGVLQNLLDDEDLSLEQFFGIILVNLSSWLHFTNLF